MRNSKRSWTTPVSDGQWPDATALLESMQRGERTALEVVTEHIERTEAQHARLNAATEILRDAALEQARTPRPGPLSGLPVSLKETFALAGHEVTAGSNRRPPVRHQADAPVVRRLRDAGAIVFARSTVPEFVMTAETRSLRWGVTNNPIDASRTCGGSTGGEGALVGSGCSPAGLGTDILGSIRIPASFCGIVGFRPASHLVDKTDVWTSGVGYFETWNGIGPLTRSVRDARLLHDVIAHAPLPAPRPTEGLRLVLPSDFPRSVRDSVIAGAEQLATRALMDTGMTHEDHSFADVRELFLGIPKLVCGESLPAWKEWLTTADGQPFRTRRELLRQLGRRPTVEPGFFMWFLMEAVMKPSPAAYEALIRMYEKARERYHALLGDDGILLLPTLGLLAPEHGKMNRTSLRPGLNRLLTAHTFVNACNLSAISVPVPRCRDQRTGLVPGIMLACAPGAEGRLLDAAAAVEAAQARPPG